MNIYHCGSNCKWGSKYVYIFKGKLGIHFLIGYEILGLKV